MKSISGGLLWGLAALGVVIWLLWDKIEELVSSITKPDPNEVRSHQDSIPVVHSDGTKENIDFNMWRGDEWKKLIGYQVVKLTEASLKDIYTKLREAGVIVYRDDEILQQIYRITNKCQVSQLAEKFELGYTFPTFMYQDLHSFLEECLSEENYNGVVEYLTELKLGATKA